jgi:hypothetical protein
MTWEFLAIAGKYRRRVKDTTIAEASSEVVKKHSSFNIDRL